MLVSGYKNFVLDFVGGQKSLINCEIDIDILESQKRQGWGSTVGEPEAAAKAAAKQQQKQHKQQEKQYKHFGSRVGFSTDGDPKKQ